jgi:hypothetical protein
MLNFFLRRIISDCARNRLGRENRGPEVKVKRRDKFELLFGGGAGKTRSDYLLRLERVKGVKSTFEVLA